MVEAADGSEILVPEGDTERLAPVVSLARREVVRAGAFKDGHLEVVFSDGTNLGVPADEGFEAWELVGPDGLRTVSLLEGLAVWWPRDETGRT